MIEIAHNDRDCEFFYSVQTPFWNAEQHLYGQRTEVLEARRRTWEAEQEKRRQDWEAEQEGLRQEIVDARDNQRALMETIREGDRRKWERDLHERSEATQRNMLRTSVAGLVITIAAVIISVWATATFAGSTVINKIELPTPIPAGPGTSPTPQR